MRERLKALEREVRDAASAVGRDGSDIRILAVSKTFPPEDILQAVEAGQTRFGENRVQEAQQKIPSVDHPELEWHLIGHLQSNKARMAVQLFDVIQSVDSIKLASRLDRVSAELGKVLPVMLQVDLAGEEQKSGVAEDRLPELLSVVDQLDHLSPRGLMTIPPYDPDPEKSRPYFKRLNRLLSDLNRGRAQRLTELSMGMSGDLIVAVEEGSTLLRIGTAIFGERD